MAKTLIDGKTPEELGLEKERRIMDAIELKIPDRVPIICGFGYFPSKNTGTPASAAYYDYNAWYKAYKDTLPDYPADFIFPQNFTPGTALEMLAPNTIRWPGYGVNEWQGHQSIEIEAMQAEDYDHFINDPSDYMFRIHLSRASEHLKGIAKLPKLSDVSGYRGAMILADLMTDPEVDHAFTTLKQIGEENKKYRGQMAEFAQMMKDLGFPQYFQGAAMPPFDIISHAMRGMSGTMMDMFRQPDKVVAAAEKILELTIARPLPPASPLGYRRMFMTNTRGSDDFMSKKQFDRFYWPTFKALVLNLIERGATPCIFFEGNFTSRIEYLLDFPKGKFLMRIDTTDIYKAKDILKGHACIQGNVPSTLLQTGTVQDVKDYCKKLIDDIGKDGGLILSPRSSTDEVKPENLKAMIDFTHEYGVYN